MYTKSPIPSRYSLVCFKGWCYIFKTSGVGTTTHVTLDSIYYASAIGLAWPKGRHRPTWVGVKQAVLLESVRAVIRKKAVVGWSIAVQEYWWGRGRSQLIENQLGTITSQCLSVCYDISGCNHLAIPNKEDMFVKANDLEGLELLG